MPPQSQMIDALGEHPGEEQRVIADVLANLPLAIKRRRGTEHRVRLQQHFSYVSDWLAGGVLKFEQLVGVTKFCQQMRHISHQLRIPNPNLVGIVLSYEIHKEFLQRMIFGNHVFSSNREPVARFQAMRLCYSSPEPNTS